MNQIITDLFGHQAWADAEIIKAITKHPKAIDDLPIRKRLNHLHQAQVAFLVIARREKLDHSMLQVIGDWTDLRKSIMRYHEEALSFIRNISDSDLEREADVPWFKNPPLRINNRELLVQAAMHTHQHRAQNSTRLRELGGEPPIIDLIMWYWKGRPKAEWE